MKQKKDGIKSAMMPQKLASVVEKLKENRESKKDNKVDLGKFVKDVARKQYEADKKESEKSEESEK